MDRLMIVSTHGKEDLERASIPFVLGVTALSSGMEASLLLQVEAVNLAKKGGTDGLKHPVFPALSELMDQYLELGGRLMACNPCLKERKIDAKDLREGILVVNAPTIVKELAEAKSVVSY